MGIAITALSDAYSLVRHNPIILGIGWLAALLLGIANVVLGFIPLLGRVISLFLWPAFLAGMLALVYSGRDGDASVDDFLDGIGDHYLPLLGSTFLLGIVVFVVAFGGLLFSFFLVPIGGPGRGLGEPSAMLATMLVPLLAIGLTVFVLGTLFQFFDVAIVADDESVVSAFGRSLDVFRSAPASVLGYTVLRAVLGSLFFIAPLVAIATVASSLLSLATVGGGSSGDIMGAGGIAVVALVAVYFFLLVPLGYVVTMTYHVAFYNRFGATAA